MAWAPLFIEKKKRAHSSPILRALTSLSPPAPSRSCLFSDGQHATKNVRVHVWRLSLRVCVRGACASLRLRLHLPSRLRLIKDELPDPPEKTPTPTLRSGAVSPARLHTRK